jgi:integrase
MSEPAFVCKNRHGTFYARFIIPKHLQPHFKNKKEIRRTLQTDSKRLAIKKARSLRVEFECIVDALMAKDKPLSARAKLIIDNLFAEKVTVNDLSSNKPDESLKDGADKTQLITVFHPETGKVLANVDYGGDETKEQPVAMSLAQAVLSAQVVQQPAIQAPLTPTSDTVSKYLDDYIANKTDPNNKNCWAKITAEKTLYKLENFRKFIGEKPASSLTQDDAEQWIKLNYLLPIGFGKELRFEEMTYDMVLSDSPELKKMDYMVRASSTVKTNLMAPRTFLSWAAKRKHIVLQIPINTLACEIEDIKTESTRRAFTPDELKILFQDNPAPENYTTGFAKPIDYWTPFIALYTGCRIMEICQLYTDDIKLVKSLSGDTEHWCFDINEDFDKNLKGGVLSKRQIPIHPLLIEAGFLDYVDVQRRKGKQRLFDGKINYQSKSFANYSELAGVTDPNTTFHSFRHTFCTHLTNKFTPTEVLIALSGHQYNSLAQTAYAKAKELDVGKLSPVIDAIDFGLTHPAFKR